GLLVVAPEVDEEALSRQEAHAVRRRGDRAHVLAVEREVARLARTDDDDLAAEGRDGLAGRPRREGAIGARVARRPPRRLAGEPRADAARRVDERDAPAVLGGGEREDRAARRRTGERARALEVPDADRLVLAHRDEAPLLDGERRRVVAMPVEEARRPAAERDE